MTILDFPAHGKDAHVKSAEIFGKTTRYEFFLQMDVKTATYAPRLHIILAYLPMTPMRLATLPRDIVRPRIS